MAELMLRDAIYAQLKAECTSFDEFYGPQQANEKTAKPYGVIRMAPESKAYKGARVKTLQVIVYVATEGWSTLDALCNEVDTALDNVNVSCGDFYFVIPMATGRTADWFDEDRQVYQKTCEYQIVLGR